MKSKNDFKYEDDYKEYLRHYFAAMAMQGLWQSTTDSGYENYNQIAKMSVLQADELINELNKQP